MESISDCNIKIYDSTDGTPPYETGFTIDIVQPGSVNQPHENIVFVKILSDWDNNEVAQALMNALNPKIEYQSSLMIKPKDNVNLCDDFSVGSLSCEKNTKFNNK